MRQTVIYERVFRVTLTLHYESVEFDTAAEAGRYVEECLLADKHVASAYAYDRKVQS